jgi:hypothetical protein
MALKYSKDELYNKKNAVDDLMPLFEEQGCF